MNITPPYHARILNADSPAEAGDDVLDAGIRRLERECRMNTRGLNLDFRTEPSFFEALAAYGRKHFLVYSRDPEIPERIVSLGVRSLRNAFVDGKPGSVAYIHNLRIAPDFQGGTRFFRGYQAFREACREDPAALTFTSILEGNDRAIQLLENPDGRGPLPRYHFLHRFLTAFIPLRGPGRRWPFRNRETAPSTCLSTRFLGMADIHALVGLFREFGQYQGVPVIQPDDSTGDRHSAFPGLPVEQFLGLFEGGNLCGAIGIWDPSHRKQVRLGNLPVPIALGLQAWNAISSRLGFPPFPDPHRDIPFVLLDPWAVSPPAEFRHLRVLLREAIRAVLHSHYLFAAWGCPEPSIHTRALRTVHHLPYFSRLYQVAWPETATLPISAETPLFPNLGSL